MDKAQKVRNRRLANLKCNMLLEAQEVFDWMLELMDEDTTKKRFKDATFKIFVQPGDYVIRTFTPGPYDIENRFVLSNSFIKQHTIGNFFFTLKSVIEAEPGFKATINPNDSYLNYPCISLTITVVE